MPQLIQKSFSSNRQVKILENSPKKINFLSPAKINFSLKVVKKRRDNFHEIESLFCPISLNDEIEFTTKEDINSDLTFSCSDKSLETKDNLIYRAIELFEEEAKEKVQGIHIHLEKKIPKEAGLGGGSSNAATILLMLNEYYKKNFSNKKLGKMAVNIGCDVPFFIENKVCFVSGIGEKMWLCPFPHKIPLILVKPTFGVSTKWAYENWESANKVPSISYTPQLTTWGIVQNDLELPVFQKYIFLAYLKMWLLSQKEIQVASMSGSGSTIFGILKSPQSYYSLKEEINSRFGESLWVSKAFTIPCEEE